METPIGPHDPGHQDVIDDLVFWVQRALRQYAEDPACGECLRLAREGLAQLQAGIVVAAWGDGIGLTGTGLTGTGAETGLVEELLRVVTGLEQGALKASPEAAAILLRAVLGLSDPHGYLDQPPRNAPPRDAPREDGLRLGQRMVNELRGLRGAAPLMLAALVNPESAGLAATLPAISASGPGAMAGATTRSDTGWSSEPDGADQGAAGVHEAGPDAPVAAAATGPIPALQAARRRFRQALLEWLQDWTGTSGARAMAEVAAEIATLLPESRSAQPDCRRLFIAVDDLMQDLALGSVSPALANKQLLGRVDRQLSQCLQRAETVELAAEAFLVDPSLITGLVEARALLAPAAYPDSAYPDALDPDAADPDDAPVAPGSPADVQEAERLARVRREGGATMARLAAAFAALEHTPWATVTEGPVPDAPVPDAPGLGDSGLGDSGSSDSEPRFRAADPAGAEARRQVAEVAFWHPRAVEALTRAAAQTQALERLVSQRPCASTRPGAGASAAPEVAPAPIAAVSQADSWAPSVVALGELQRQLAAAIGDASAALLQQQRAIGALEESLVSDPPASPRDDRARRGD